MLYFWTFFVHIDETPYWKSEVPSVRLTDVPQQRVPPSPLGCPCQAIIEPVAYLPLPVGRRTSHLATLQPKHIFNAPKRCERNQRIIKFLIVKEKGETYPHRRKDWIKSPTVC
jgi:hypothetical protein